MLDKTETSDPIFNVEDASSFYQSMLERYTNRRWYSITTHTGILDQLIKWLVLLTVVPIWQTVLYFLNLKLQYSNSLLLTNIGLLYLITIFSAIVIGIIKNQLYHRGKAKSVSKIIISPM